MGQNPFLSADTSTPFSRPQFRPGQFGLAPAHLPFDAPNPFLTGRPDHMAMPGREQAPPQVNPTGMPAQIGPGGSSMGLPQFAALNWTPASMPAPITTQPAPSPGFPTLPMLGTTPPLAWGMGTPAPAPVTPTAQFSPTTPGAGMGGRGVFGRIFAAQH